VTRNGELFVKDPRTTEIPNLGVAKVVEPAKPEEWAVLRWELGAFVCEGEYRIGLERILRSYLTHLDKPEQPAVWVSGFYGSGKSHLVRVLQHLWRDLGFPDGATARGLATLPDDTSALFRELSTAGRRGGGLWAAGGTLGAAAGDKIRLALLAILFRSANLPPQYAPAKFVIWLKQEGHYDVLKAKVEERDRIFERELSNLYVSPVLAESLLEVSPKFAPSAAEALKTLREQFHNPADISDEDLFRAIEDVLLLKSTAAGKLPCTVLVLDELQQFIGEDSVRTLQVQNTVEACASRFGSRLLFVATGQAALQATTQLSKLQGRFQVRVMLSDSDVQQVVRQVVLRKRPDRVGELKAKLERLSGEIDRHLLSTKIGASGADARDLVPDYPLLPVRRRFWERVLRAVDPAGTAGQLRTQLMIVHHANQEIADEPLGHVIPADAIYGQVKAGMLQSSVLLPDQAKSIDGQDDGTTEGPLRSRLCALAFLIGRLPTEGPAAAGVRATADVLADLLVEDLGEGSAALRERIPRLLGDLTQAGTLMLVDGEYRLQTHEGSVWEGDYRDRLKHIYADEVRLASARTDGLRKAVDEALNGIVLVQGVTKTPRKFQTHFSLEAPPEGDVIPVWVRDEWSVAEKTVREEARLAGQESPVVHVFLPRRDADELKKCLASCAAAQECVNARPVPTTAEGAAARSAMQSRAQSERSKVHALMQRGVEGARVFQAGGNELEGSFEKAALQALAAAIVRMFPQFGPSDVSGWDAAAKQASEGSSDSLRAVGHTGAPEGHPVCQRVRDHVVSRPSKGREIRAHFANRPYGWPQDAIDATLLALLQGGVLRATKNGQPATAHSLRRTDIGITDFSNEGVIVTPSQRLAVRKLFQDLGIPAKAGEELEAIRPMLDSLIDKANLAGGDTPLPAPPRAERERALLLRAGNELFMAVYEQREQLLEDYRSWSAMTQKGRERQPRWVELERLARHGTSLPVSEEVAPQLESLVRERTLLAEPDPMGPLTSRLADGLRSALTDTLARYVAEKQKALAELERSDAWKGLSVERRRQILAGVGLADEPKLDVGDIPALLRALDATPLLAWDDKIAAVLGRAKRALERAAEILEPQAFHFSPRQATLKTTGEVEGYLEELRTELLKLITAGRTVIYG